MSVEIMQEQNLFNSALDHYKKNSLKKAQMLFEEIIEMNSTHSDAYFYLGNIFHMKGMLGKAIKALNKVLELDPEHTDAAISLSVILNDIGRYEEAQKVFERANEKVKNEKSGLEDPHINKKFASKHFELAEMYFTYNRYDEALFEYNKVSSLDTENLEVRIKIAKVYAKKGYISKAFEELKKLKAEYPGYIPCRVALGLLHYGKGNTIEAQTEWEVALRKDPSNQEIQMYLNLSHSATETNLNA